MELLVLGGTEFLEVNVSKINQSREETVKMRVIIVIGLIALLLHQQAHSTDALRLFTTSSFAKSVNNVKGRTGQPLTEPTLLQDKESMSTGYGGRQNVNQSPVEAMKQQDQQPTNPLQQQQQQQQQKLLQSFVSSNEEQSEEQGRYFCVFVHFLI